MNMDATTIKNDLAEFRGTTTYHKHLLPGNTPLLITDGCNFIREQCKAFWLFDAILSYQCHSSVKSLSFQIWRLVQMKGDMSWELMCYEDIHLEPIITQKIEYSDFPLEEIKIWVIDGVALLPSEY